MDSWEILRNEAGAALARSDLTAGAASIWTAALDMAESTFGRADRRFATSLEALAEIYFRQGKYALAEPMCLTLLGIYESTLGADHASVGVVSQNIAMLYHAQGKTAQAEPCYDRALRLRRKALGAQHPDVQNLVSAYVHLLTSTGRLADAEQVKADAESVASGKWNRSGHYRAISIPAPEQLTAAVLLSDVDAEPESTAGIAAGIEGSVTDKWSRAMSAGDASLESGDDSAAEQHFFQALSVLDHAVDTAGSLDEQLTMTLESLAEVLWKEGKYVEAQPYCERTLETYERMLGPTHQDVGVIANNLAMLYHAVELYGKAEGLYKRALAIRTASLGSSHPDIISLMTNYANLLYVTKREREAGNLKNYINSLTSGRWTRCGQFKAMSAPLSAGAVKPMTAEQAHNAALLQPAHAKEPPADLLLYERLLNTTAGDDEF